MREGFIFWQQDVRLLGSNPLADADSRLRGILYGGPLTLTDRLTGTMEGPMLTLWRTGPFAQAGDIVEFRGALRPDGDGCVIEGTVNYKLRTKVQFLGCLVFGIVLVGIGFFQAIRDASPGIELSGVGAVVAVATLLWIFASRNMVKSQIAFIESKLGEALDSEPEEADSGEPT